MVCLWCRVVVGMCLSRDFLSYAVFMGGSLLTRTVSLCVTLRAGRRPAPTQNPIFDSGPLVLGLPVGPVEGAGPSVPS